jgi:hypothetical protein
VLGNGPRRANGAWALDTETLETFRCHREATPLTKPSSCEEVIQGKMEPDAEHQQDDANLREFSRQCGIGDKTRGERTDQHAGEKVADDR